MRANSAYSAIASSSPSNACSRLRLKSSRPVLPQKGSIVGKAIVILSAIIAVRILACPYLSLIHIWEEAKARILLARGTDRGKDQSYALYGLTQDMLKHALFPLGNFTKQHVREIAAQKGIITAEKPESQEICFVTQGSYRTFLEERNVKMLPGLFADTSGKVLGHHKGLAFYTVGQRKGLGISSPYPLYVVGIDAGENVVIVGKRNEAYSEGCYIEDLNFVMVDHLDSPVEGTCMVRYRGKEVPATLIPLKNDLLHRGPGPVSYTHLDVYKRQGL